MQEDKYLIWRLNRGSPEALRAIYDKYRQDLLKVAAALLHDRNAMEDVLHDVFVNLAESAGSFRLRGSLKGYLAICVANQARDRNRAGRHRTTGQLNETKAVHPARHSPVDGAIADELTEILSNALRQLPYEQLEVIILHLQGNLRFKQIAQAHGVSINTVQSRYRYGLEKLRLSLNSELEK